MTAGIKCVINGRLAAWHSEFESFPSHSLSMIDKSSLQSRRTACARRRLLLLAASSICADLSLLTVYQMASQPGSARGSRVGGTSASGRSGRRGGRGKSKGAGRTDATAEAAEIGAESDAQTTTTDKSGKKDRAVWTDDEVRTLVTYLHKHKAAGGDGGFKSLTWNGATAHLNKTYPNAAPKQMSQVSSKYVKGVRRL